MVVPIPPGDVGDGRAGAIGGCVWSGDGGDRIGEETIIVGAGCGTVGGNGGSGVIIVEEFYQ